MKDEIKKLFQTAEATLQGFYQDEANLQAISGIVDLISDAFCRGNKVIIFGNGGSMCDAMHFAEELTGRFRKDRPALPAIALSDPAHLTCVANDYGFDEVFARGVQAYAKADDVVIGISTSGNSPNVIKAAEEAKRSGLLVVGFSGNKGKLKELSDFAFCVDSDITARIQEVHILLAHILCDLTERMVFNG